VAIVTVDGVKSKAFLWTAGLSTDLPLVSLRQEMLSDSRLSLAMPMMAAGGGV